LGAFEKAVYGFIREEYLKRVEEIHLISLFITVHDRRVDELAKKDLMSSMKVVSRWASFREKKKDRIVKELLAELFDRAYCYDLFRACARPFFRLNRPEKWVFIVGCYNSGTTLLKELLASHPDIRTLPREGVRFTSELTRPEDIGWTRMWSRCEDYVSLSPEIDSQKATRILKDWAPWLNGKTKVFLEKSIAHVPRMEWLDMNFENAFFIGITRSGYSASEGIRRKARPKGHAARMLGQSAYPIELAGKQWVRSNEILLRSAENVGHFKLISYEQLMKDPLGLLIKLWSFAGLNPARANNIPGGIRIEDKEFMIKDRNPESIARLSSKDIARLNPEIGNMQLDLGYDVIE